MEIDKFKTEEKVTWCQGCGNFGIWVALRQAFLELGWGPEDVLLVYGIGCHGHMINYLNNYGFDALHGRGLPLAQGAKLANKNLNVIVIAGDGDQFGEGGNHFIHAARRNLDITCIIHDNQIYGLTVGQTSPTSEKGFVTKSTPHGAPDQPVNPISLSLASEASFVARGFSGDVKHLTKLFVDGLKHKGFSVIDVLQPCVTLNHLNTFQYFFQRVYKLDEAGHNHNDKISAFTKSFEWGDKIPIGLFYKEERPILEELLPQLKPEEKSLVDQDIYNIEIKSLFEEFK
ncbi:MAG: 2-oxoacid:ferredoxin oxidoreductase subunit beta [Candidatus Nealsonbacteria bacterium]|nr:2-oxoacid:ferredoxin oxidoreductase subunit beta [Candidatus Nealsonbacteria bacterium]